MKKYLLVIACIFTGMASNAQSFAKLEKKNGANPFTVDIFKLYARTTSVASTFTPSYSGFTFNIALADNGYGKGDKRMRYENPTLGDFIHMIPSGVRDIKAITNDQATDPTPDKWEDHAHGGGFFGWMQFYFNAVAKDKLLVSPGFSFGDYIYGSNYAKTPGGSKVKHGPYGYYLVAGPAVMATYLLNSKMWIDGYVNYDISLYKVKNDENPADYPKPHFLTVGADLYTTKNLFGGVRLNKVLDKGGNNDNKSSRFDISAGILF